MKRRVPPRVISAAEFHQRANAADRLAAEERFSEAEQALRSLLKDQPGNPTVMMTLARCLRVMDRLSEAEALLRKAWRKLPGDTHVAVEMSELYARTDRFTEARRSLDSAIAKGKDLPRLLGAKGAVFASEGRYEDAAEVLEPAIEQFPDAANLAVVYSTIAPRVHREDRAVDYLQAVRRLESIEPRMRISALFALGQLLDKMGRHEEGFELLIEANAAKAHRFDVERFGEAVDELTRKWTRKRMAGLPRADPVTEKRFVYILGMPRSGTSLIEQIVASHPDVYGGGELTALPRLVRQWLAGFDVSRVPILSDPAILRNVDLNAAARHYVQRATQLAGRSQVITDKLPLNFLFIGVIQQMFPNARIIHCIRDPMDTCVSCFYHDFLGMPFTSDLRNVGIFYRHYERIMAHWKEHADLPILDAVYEETVADVERQARALIDFVGLEWNDACLRYWENRRGTHTSSRDQVRQPIYKSSVERWRRYERFLDPLKEGLAFEPGKNSDRPIESSSTS